MVSLQVMGKVCLELGCGPGLVSVAASLAGKGSRQILNDAEITVYFKKYV
jgi:predicted nicotinamide N-methyase